MVKTWYKTFRGPTTMNGRPAFWSEVRIGGGGERAWTVTLELLWSSACSGESRVELSNGITKNDSPRRTEVRRTIVTNQRNTTSVFRDAHSMILHAWTSANIS